MSSDPVPYRGIYVGVVTGASLAVVTMAVPKLSTISDQWLVGAIQKVLTVLIFPGLIAAAGVSGNSHAFSLIVSATINGVIYVLVGWFLYSIFAKIKRRHKV